MKHPHCTVEFLFELGIDESHKWTFVSYHVSLPSIFHPFLARRWNASTGRTRLKDPESSKRNPSHAMPPRVLLPTSQYPQLLPVAAIPTFAIDSDSLIVVGSFGGKMGNSGDGRPISCGILYIDYESMIAQLSPNRHSNRSSKGTLIDLET
jgi:hypothetical protein